MREQARTVLFPLRSNAYSLVAGAGVESVRRRLKIAALMFDRLILEAGQVTIGAGPTGNVEFPRLSSPARWQAASDRKQGTPLTLAIGSNDSPREYRTALHIECSLLWQPTFDPFADELPGSAIDWLSFGEAKPEKLPALKRIAAIGARADQSSDAFRERFSDGMARAMVATNMNRDLVLAAAEGCAISVDPLHRRLIDARALAGTVRPAFGPAALKILYPRVERLAWTDIVAIREHKDVEYLRAALREIEHESTLVASSAAGFTADVRERFDAALAAANLRLRSSTLKKFAFGLIGLVAGEIATFLSTGVPLVGGVVGFATGLGAEEATDAVKRPRWLAAHEALRGVLPSAKPRALPAAHTSGDDEADPQ